MKKIFLITLLALFFVGCKQATIETPAATTTEETTAVTTDDTTTATTTSATTPTTETKPYYVKNSKWEDVDISTLSTARAVADPSVDEALEIIATYNAANNDDQLRLYTTDVPITEAPTVDVYIAKAVDGYYVILVKVTGMDRSYYVEKKQLFEQDAATQGGVLFVDKVPETVPVVVVPVDTRTRHEKYSIYMINKYNKIVVYGGLAYEKHIDEIWDPLSDEVKAGYNNNIDNLMNWYISAFNSESVCQTYDDAPWRVAYGQIYTEPTE